MMISSKSFPLKIFKRNLRRAIKAVNSEESKTYQENKIDVFNTVEKEIDLKTCENLSTIARFAIESNFDVLKSFNNGQKLLNNNNKFVEKQFKINENYRNFRNNLLNEIKITINNDNNVKDNEIKSKIDKNEAIEDPNIPPSKYLCGGCGANFQCNDKTKAGFILLKKFNEFKKNKNLFSYKLCVRCELLRNRQKKYTGQNVINIEDYEKNVLNMILESKQDSLVILLIDLLDMPNSIYDGWSKLFEKNKKNIDIFIIGSKLDLLPNTGPTWKEDIMKCLEAQCAKKGIKGDQIKFVRLISAKNGYNIENLISNLFYWWNNKGDVYLLGVTNSGKSVLYNSLLSSDYCLPIASEALLRATTSYWPNTTLNMLKFPILKLDSKKYEIRRKRLKEDLKLEKTKLNEKFKKFKKDFNIEDATLFGIVNTSFKPYSIHNYNEINTNIDASYSFDDKEGKIKEGINSKCKKDVKKEFINEARMKYNPNLNENMFYFYDTPGISAKEHILSKFSNSEVEIAVPKIMILPRVIWMIPGQTLFVGGVIRIDLLESTNNERVLFSLMTNMRLPIIQPFDTATAEQKYEDLFLTNKLVVPYSESSERNTEKILDLISKDFTIKCVGNYLSTADIVFSCFGWAAVTSRPEITAKIRAYTIDGSGLNLREPSLLPYVVNMRRLYCHNDKKQNFVSRFTRVAYDINF